MSDSIVLPALWRDGLINNDWVTLESDFPDEAVRAKAWQIESGLTVIGCEHRAFFALYEDVKTMCLQYHYIDPFNETEFDRVLCRIEQGNSTVYDARFIRYYVAGIRRGTTSRAHQP